MSLQERKRKIKHQAIADAIGMEHITIAKYFQGKLKNTATQRKIAEYLDKVHNQEIKGILSSK